jgi:1-acyl-sn-glycerol-3-phosphate acyltransferase
VRLSYRFTAFCLRLFFRTFYRLEVRGLEQIPATGSLILAANHQSNLDPPLIGAFFPREMGFVAKKQLFDHPIMSRLMHHFNSIPLDRSGVDLKAIRTIRKRLSQGQALVVFPEGTRSRDGQLGQPRAGLGLIVAAAEAEVLPILVQGSRHRPALPGFRRSLLLHFGTLVPRHELPLDASGDGDGKGRQARAEAVTQAIFQHIKAMHAAAGGTGERASH